MPLNTKGRKILNSMKETYGSEEKAKSVLYASKNKGTITGVDNMSGTTTSMPPTTTPPNSPASTTAPVTGDEDEQSKGPKGVLKPIGEMPEEKPIKQESGGGPSGTPDRTGYRLAQDRPPDKVIGTVRDYAAAAGAKR